MAPPSLGYQLVLQQVSSTMPPPREDNQNMRIKIERKKKADNGKQHKEMVLTLRKLISNDF